MTARSKLLSPGHRVSVRLPKGTSTSYVQDATITLAAGDTLTITTAAPPPPPVEPPPPPAPGLPASMAPAWIVPPAIPVLSARGVPYVVAPFGTQAIRVGEAGQRHGYARRQAFTADNRHVLLDYPPRRSMIDVATFAVVADNLSTPGNATCSNTDPDIIFGNAGAEFRSFAWRTGQTVRRWTFAGFPQVSLGFAGGEGAVSDDDATVALMARDAAGQPWILVVDLTTGEIVARRQLAVEPNNVSISHSGAYVMAVGPDTVLYDRLLNPIRTVAPGTEHGDFVRLADGRDAWVAVLPEVEVHDPATGAKRAILPAGSAWRTGHASGRHFRLPGWVGLSGYRYVAGQVGADQIILARLEGPPEVKPFGWGYNRLNPAIGSLQPSAVWSPDGTMAIVAAQHDGQVYGTLLGVTP